MKFLKNISLLVSGALLLLHTFIPHEHHSELEETTHIAQHEQADDIFDFLQLVFHLDLGGDHLEDYRTADFYFIVPGSLAPDLTPKYNFLPKETFSAFIERHPSKEDIRCQQFRGPPSLA